MSPPTQARSSRSTGVRGIVVAFALAFAFTFACGGVAPAGSVADAGPDGASSADIDGSSADGAAADSGLAPIRCGDLTCAGATPLCLEENRCGFAASDCTTPTSDGGACPQGYDSCQKLLGTPGCLALVLYRCVAVPECQPVGPRTYGKCTC